MILANITSYIGQDLEAEHYYCSYIISSNEIPKQHNSSGDKNELLRVLNESQARNLNLKDGSHYRIGDKTNRFDSIEQIHKTLIKKFPKENIVTYKDDKVFKEMLCVVEGKNLGYKYFGEVWVTVPYSCFKDIIPKEHKIKCYHCNREYLLEDVSIDQCWNDNRTGVVFLKRRDVDDHCDCYDLVWNVIL